MKTIRATVTRHNYSRWRRQGNLKISDPEIFSTNTFLKQIGKQIWLQTLFCWVWNRSFFRVEVHFDTLFSGQFLCERVPTLHVTKNVLFLIKISLHPGPLLSVFHRQQILLIRVWQQTNTQTWWQYGKTLLTGSVNFERSIAYWKTNSWMYRLKNMEQIKQQPRNGGRKVGNAMNSTENARNRSNRLMVIWPNEKWSRSRNDCRFKTKGKFRVKAVLPTTRNEQLPY